MAFITKSFDFSRFHPVFLFNEIRWIFKTAMDNLLETVRVSEKWKLRVDLWKNQEEIPPPLYVNPNEGGDGPIQACSLIPNRFVRKNKKLPTEVGLFFMLRWILLAYWCYKTPDEWILRISQADLKFWSSVERKI